MTELLDNPEDGCVLPNGGSSKGNGMAVAGFALSILGWALILLFPFAFICWMLGAAFSFQGERGAVRRGLPRLWLARAGIAISILPIAAFTTILLVGNYA